MEEDKSKKPEWVKSHKLLPLISDQKAYHAANRVSWLTKMNQR
jgi:hypothetical protein